MIIFEQENIMSTKLSHEPKAGGGYNILVNGTIIDSTDTLKEARNMIAKIKRESKRSNLIHKYFKYSGDFNQK